MINQGANMLHHSHQTDVADLEQAIIHLHTQHSTVRIDDANLAMLNRPAGTISQITACSGL